VWALYPAVRHMPISVLAQLIHGDWTSITHLDSRHHFGDFDIVWMTAKSQGDTSLICNSLAASFIEG
jgi:hypothetical protein